MKKNVLLILFAFAANNNIVAQKVYTKNGAVSFFSKATLENISADNNEVVSLLNEQTGELQFSVLIKSFHFKKSLMEEHFNENYMESDKYPKAIFKGQINSKVNFTADGNYPVEVSGQMTMHGVTNNITASGTISVKAGVVSATSKFKIKPADYKIVIPGIVKDNIAETLDITVSCLYDQKI
jgi:polyisoprenoid-binding protein YceI